jgi:hypothetical protein
MPIGTRPVAPCTRAAGICVAARLTVNVCDEPDKIRVFTARIPDAG